MRNGRRHASTVPAGVSSHADRYVLSLGIIAGITALGIPLRDLVAPPNLVMLYLLGVVVAALYLGRGPAALAALLSVLGFDFFFVPPHLSFAVSDTQYLLTFVGLLAVGLVISTLTARAREQADAAQQREMQALAQYELSRDLAAAEDLATIVDAVLTHVRQVFERHAAVLLPDDDGKTIRAAAPGYEFDQSELAVADWVYRARPPGRTRHRHISRRRREGICPLPRRAAPWGSWVYGRQTQTSCFHLNSGGSCWHLPARLRWLSSERSWRSTTACLRCVRQRRRLQGALLNSISHELRTPLVAITGTLGVLEEDGDRLDGASRRSLASNRAPAGRTAQPGRRQHAGYVADRGRGSPSQARAGDAQELIVAALDQARGTSGGPHSLSYRRTRPAVGICRFGSGGAGAGQRDRERRQVFTPRLRH